ncbi:hypothetical protein CDL15_Pgr019855 [Punica granatum]|uniref:Leucine-rich repeat-containing N-terminal plant-type domain-containing protein n=1 Tax=Punica granatum TaxID=22663 RepID=A0A218W3P3_PUNGR|nr:hypothetical protein CDL15_Pgr019855 [Punica granatum]
MRDIWVFPFLFLFLFLVSFLIISCHLVSDAAAAAVLTTSSQHYLSHINECDALLQFNSSFTVTRDASKFQCDTSYPKTASWKNGTDCCSWAGVTCHPVAANRVIGLDLSCSQLKGTLHSNNTLFLLPNLRRLNLAGNDFYGSLGFLPRFGIFTRLAHLNLSESNFFGPISLEISHLSRLITLDLSGNFYLTIEDRSFRWLTHNLTQLRELILDDTDMSSISPLSLANFSSSDLTSLSLKRCNLRGIVPIDIFHLPNLRSLSLSSNNLRGTLPQTKNWTSPLVYLDLSETKFSGSILASVGNLTSMTILDLSSAQFSGSIPLTLGNLVHLTHLDLSHNYFGRTVDFEIFARLKNLQYLSLTENTYLNVSLQSDGNCSFPVLRYLYLSDIRLTKFPYFLSSSAELKGLDLSGNMISGGIPKWFWRVGRNTLTEVDFSDNDFNGPLPDPHSSIETFDASSNNFSGEIPSSICQASSLTQLDLSNNRLSGTIPRCLGDLKSLLWLDASNNSLTGEIPSLVCQMGNLSSLSSLDLSYNLLQGPLPQSLANCTSLQHLIVSYNAISDTFPGWLNAVYRLKTVHLQFNRFHGAIEIPLPPQISSLNLSNNEFSGQLPINFLLNSTAEFVVLANNNFEGPLPILSPSVNYYFVSNNEFSGDIPYQLCNATGLEIINLSNNCLTGTIPHCLINVSVSVLDLQGNQFVGQIPEIIFTEESWIRTIRLGQNQLRGTLPRSLTRCNNLEVLDLGKNELEDQFPYWIPSSVENLTNLEWLDLSSNKLNGEIPKGLADLSSLSTLNLSYNQLVGPIPHGPQMDTFNHPFEGNPGLCGPPLSNPCDTLEQSPPHSTSPEEEEGHWIEWRAVAMGCGCGLIFGMSAGYLMLETGRLRWLVRMVQGKKRRKKTKYKIIRRSTRGQ